MTTTREELEQELGKKFPNEKTFARSDTTFEAIRKAEAFAREQGFSVGRMQSDAPMGLKRGDVDIQKWRNIDFSDRRRIDGAILGADKRHGPVTVCWTDEECD